MNRTSRVFTALSGLLASGIVASAAFAQATPELPPQPPQLPPIPTQPVAGSPFTVYPVRDGVFMITGPGSNVTVQTGRDGVLVVDAGTATAAPGLLAEIRKLSSKPIMYLMLTNGDADHVGGNHIIAASGVLLEGGNTRPSVVTSSGGAPIWAHEGVLNRLTEENFLEGLPTDSYFVEQKDLHYNAEAVSLVHAPGHTTGDSFVVFRRSDVISAGDIFTPDRYPQIDIAHGGSIQGVLDSLNYLLRLTVPEFNQQGGTFVVPGHGRLSDEADVAEYRDMITFINDRVKSMIAKRQTLAQIKAARPTLDYDPLFGREAGDVFVDQIYQSLTSKGAKK